MSDSNCRDNLLSVINSLVFLTGVLGYLIIMSPAMAEPGVNNGTIRIGSTQPLKSDIQFIAEGMKNGMEAALKNQKVKGQSIELVVLNDFYEPSTTVKAAKELIEGGIFLMLGSTGSSTAKAV
ncbi:MAG: ABC transporter substrate-binding protein, partial [Candidatus Competibacter sp.]|nr:ABC transporter substrate-binding protein [Candidatus Competibacter sp.]